MKKLGFTTTLLLTLIINTSAQGFLRADKTEIINDNGPFLIKSIGTGNWMIMEGYMMQSTSADIHTHTEFRNKLTEQIGEKKTATFYKLWLENHFTKADLDSMKTWGFNALRPALHYKWFTLPIEDEPIAGENSWVNTGFEMLDSLLAWAEVNKMYIILDMHGVPGGQGKNADISDYNHELPSLWESKVNQDKLVALWVKLAERYKNNPWVGGYDFINEPNWSVDGSENENGCDCENNDPIWDMHQRLIKEVRKVDQNHLVYISGNCWGNNYKSYEQHPLNGFDQNMAITFHKYWNTNNQESIHDFVAMREKLNIPLWMSESGENSNQWFADAIHLFESNNIGWSWWPVKKSRTNNIFKVTTPTSYTELIDSWKKDATPLSEEETYTAVMDYLEAHKLNQCIVAYDVINAMLNNHDSSTTLPFKQHKAGNWIACVDYDMGRDGFAYHDALSENINTGEHHFRPWNEGQVYRNDGVDIAKKDDSFYVGWTEDGEWLQYTLQVDQAGIYQLEIETAAKGNSGILSFEVNGNKLDHTIALPKSEEWKTSILKDFELAQGEVKIRLKIDKGGSDLKAFKLFK